MYTIKQGDTLDVFTAYLEDEDGAFDLTTATLIELIWRRRLNGQVAVVFECTSSAPTTGVVTYAWQPGDTDGMSGDYEYDIKVTLDTGDTKTWPTDNKHEPAYVYPSMYP